MTFIVDAAVSTCVLVALHVPLAFWGMKAHQKKRLSAPLR
jgi:hypothetical protein